MVSQDQLPRVVGQGATGLDCHDTDMIGTMALRMFMRRSVVIFRWSFPMRLQTLMVRACFMNYSCLRGVTVEHCGCVRGSKQYRNRNCRCNPERDYPMDHKSHVGLLIDAGPDGQLTFSWACSFGVILAHFP